MRSSYVIIGNGIAGVTAAEVLRAQDAGCRLTMVADDPFPAYYRPALKDFLGGHLAEERLWARPATFYTENNIRFLPARVTGLHPEQHRLDLHNGQILTYDRLLLANGARARTLTCPDTQLNGVFTLRSVADYRQILQRLPYVRHVVIVGSGTLALESAETLVQQGYTVTHLLRGRRLWSEVLDEVASDMVLQEERRAGIEVCLEEEITEITGQQGEVREVHTSRGRRLACELVLVAIGITPEIDFLRDNGITCGRGVQVDKFMRTNIPDIYAAGDVVEIVEELSGRARLLGQWYPAILQARLAARHMAGQERSSAAPVDDTLLYNATFLRGLSFVSLGLTTRPPGPAFQEIVAEPQARSYRKVILRDGQAVGALLLGDRSQALAFKRAIDHQINLLPVARRLFTPDFDLEAWLTQQGVPAPLFTPEQALPTTPLPASQNNFEGARLIPPAILRALPDTPTLVLMGPDGIPHTLPLAQDRRYRIGRAMQNEIVLTDPSTSHQHAEIAGTPAGFVIRDLNSRYGVFLNREKLHQEKLLAHGDYLVIGNVLIYFSAPAGRSPNPFVPIQAATGQESFAVGLEHRTEIAPLDTARLTFEIDMCIGCNRCMDACPLPSSTRVDIATLNHATGGETIPGEIERFVHECIMCGSCVPVCPVDNHRDLLMLALKQRLGLAWEKEPDLAAVQRAIPAGWTAVQILQALRAQRIFSYPGPVPDKYLLHLVAASHLLALKTDDMLLREGEYGRDLYLILNGQLSLLTGERERNGLLLGRLARGEYAGEDGMLTGQPYNVSVRATQETLVLQVPEQVMRRLMELQPGIRKHFERVVQATSLRTILARLELFEGIAPDDLQTLLNQAQVRQYERGTRLFAEDRLGRPSRETLHIVLEGFVKVARQVHTGASQETERIIAYRQAGDYFAGGLDLLGDGQPVTVTTINRCRVAEVPRQAVLALFQCYPAVEQRFAARLRDYLEAAASAPHDASLGLHALVSDGVVEGTEVLVIDLDKCIHCDECENACKRRHGHSRMNRQGMVIGNMSIATACRQCQDPVCLLCSRAGIARRPDGEVYITASCIGCGICAERCPYGAISIVPVEEETEERAGERSWRRFQGWFAHAPAGKRARKTLPVLSPAANGNRQTAAGPLNPPPADGGYDELRKKIAIKCDLCAGYRDQACVRACPTGAAIRVQPGRFFGSTEEILLTK